MLLISKKDGDAKVEKDYRKLNEQTVNVRYPTSNLDEYLEVLYSSKLITTLNLDNLKG